MIDFLRRHWIAVGATFIFWIWVALLLRLTIAHDQGHWVYTYDDTYIHLAIARNLAEHGIWGVTQHGFTSSASSLLWPLLLAAGGLLTGFWEQIPLALNLILSTVLIWLVYFMVRRYHQGPILLAVVMLFLLVLVPLPSLAITGMEHVLQIVLDFAFFFTATAILLRAPAAGGQLLSRKDLPLLLLAPLVVMARFEGIFIVDIVCLLLAIRGRWLLAGLLGVLALLPVGVYGMISLGNHWYFLPNSVLLKGQLIDVTSLAGIVAYLKQLYHRMVAGKLAVLLLIGVLDIFLLLRQRRRTIWSPTGVLSVIFLAVIAQHILFAAYDFRYGSYLVAIGTIIMAMSLTEYLGTFELPATEPVHRQGRLVRGLLVMVVPLVLLSAAHRGLAWCKDIVLASTNIYQQQYQMGEFVREYYADQPIAVNDIGAVSYFGRARTVDLEGLANMEAASMRRARRFDAGAVKQLTSGAGVKFAMVYDTWYEGGKRLPPDWTKVGEWKINNNIICGGDVVSIYAVDPAEKGRLIQSLQEFAPKLPKDVEQRGEYTLRLSAR
jgi:hypothetical protein